MANALNEDLTDKVVIFGQKYLRVTATEHPFRVSSAGFGAKPYTAGNALSGEFLSDGEVARMEGFMVERYATDDKIDAAVGAIVAHHRARWHFTHAAEDVGAFVIDLTKREAA